MPKLKVWGNKRHVDKSSYMSFFVSAYRFYYESMGLCTAPRIPGGSAVILASDGLWEKAGNDVMMKSCKSQKMRIEISIDRQTDRQIDG